MKIVLDTNILLHYKSFEEISWEKELGSKDNTVILDAIVLKAHQQKLL